MGKFDNILIVSDIDGTYLGEKRETVPRNVEAILNFKKEGGTFTFATGRMARTFLLAIPNVRELTDFPIALNNGTCLYDFHTDTPIYSEFMEEDTARRFVTYTAEKFPEIGFRASIPGGYTYAYDHPYIERDLRIYKLPTEHKRPLSEWDYSRIYKIAFREKPENLIRLREDIEPLFDDELCIIMSEREILEAQRKGSSKGAVIERIRRDFREKGTPKRIVCIGDHENDFEMLRAADIAACPSNAIDSVKAICDVEVCSCSDGAIADLIEYLDAHPELRA